MSDTQKPMRNIWQSYVGSTVGRLFIVRYNKGEQGTIDTTIGQRAFSQASSTKELKTKPKDKKSPP